MLQIHLFGQPRFLADGVPFKFAAPRKALALLAYLLLNRTTAIARDSLAFTLWSEDTEEDARTELRRHLNYLKNALPPAAQTPWIRADSDTVQWNPAAEFWFDVAEFERLTSLDGAAERAVELYCGDLLENLYDDWLFPARERLRNRLLDCLSSLLLESRSRRDFARALTYAQRMMSFDPWREDVVRQIMSVRYESGDRAGALREYDQFARRLRDEMDVTPMPDTTALRDAIARNAPASDLAPAGDQTQDEGQAAPLLPLVGRQVEMDQLRALWNRAARGRGGAALVSGEAGIGKSRLTSELALIVGAQGGRVLTGATLHPESTPYQPIADALRSATPLLAALEIQPLWLAAVAQIVPDVRARRPDLPVLAELDPSRERVRLFEAIAAALHALARARPVLLVLEDLQWAGDATISALEFLARRAATQPVLIAGTYRSDEARPDQPLRDLRRRLQRENLVGHIDLARLPASAVKDLFSRVPELAARGDAAALTAYAESEGNPLFLVEVIRGLVEPSEAQSSSRGLRELIKSRVARLSEPARFVAQAAAVAGTVFDVDTVSQISGWPENETLQAVDELVSHHVVREAGRRAAFDYAFTHHLVQNAIYDSIPSESRSRWHRRAATAMTAMYPQFGDRIAPVLAHHLDLAGDAGAAHQYMTAARSARAVYANEEALQYAKRGLELAADPDLTYELLSLEESLYNRAGQRDEQRRVLDLLERSARDGGSESSDRLCDVFDRRITLHRVLGEPEQERTWIELFEAGAKSAAQPRWQARAALARSRHETRGGRLAEAQAALATATTVAAREGEVTIETEALCELAYIGTLQGRTEEGSAALARAEAAAASSNNQALLAHTLHSASTAAVLREDFAAAQALAERAMELYQLVGDREGEADCCALLALAAARRLLIDPAYAFYDKARTLYAELGKRRGQAAVLVNSGVLDFMVGMLDDSIRESREAERMFAELDDRFGVALCALNVGIAKYYLGEYHEAKAQSMRAVELARELGSMRAQASALGNLGAVERELDETDASLEHLHACLDLREEAGWGPDGALDLAELALTHVRRGDKAQARAMADRLMALDERSYEMASTPQIVPWAAAKAYLAAGQRKLAKEARDRWRALATRRLAAMPERVRAAYGRLPFNKEL